MTVERTEAAELEDLERRRTAKAGATTRSNGEEEITDTTGYPVTAEVQLICEKGCGKDFVVPVYYISCKRTVGPFPQRCSDCVGEMDRREEQRIEADAERLRRQDAESTRRRVLELVGQAGGNPFEYSRHTLDSFEPYEGREKAVQVIREWVAAITAESDPYAKIRGLYFVGETGTAKTALAHCALRAFIEAGYEPGKDVIFDNALSLIEKIQDTYSSGASTWDILERRFNARVWIIDDLGSEKPGDDVVRKLTVIFSRREGRPTMVTSNLDAGALTSRNDELFRLASRFGPAQFRHVQITGDDGRFRKEPANLPASASGPDIRTVDPMRDDVRRDLA